MSELTGAEIFIKSLEKEDVDVIFGYPGGSVIPIFDSLMEADLKNILPHHEQGGIHAADGYARSTGKAGVCLVTSGPGATNLVTGLATAYMDSVPVVAFSGQVATSLLGTDAFQEADIKGISMPVTKHNFLVHDVDELAGVIKQAFHIAQEGRPGPVLVDMPVDILKKSTEFFYPEDDKMDYIDSSKQQEKSNEQPQEKLQLAAKKINEAQKPVIYAGGGVILSEGSQELRDLANKASIPVATTLMGIGSFDEREELSLGMLGMHGSTEANLAVTNTDLLLAVGARFDDRVTGNLDTFAPEAEIIHIDIDPAEINKIVEVDVALQGDVKDVLKQLTPLVKKGVRKQWLTEINKWKKLDDGGNEPKEKLRPRQIIEELYNLTEGEALLTTEVGQHQMWAAQYYKFSQPRSLMTSGGLGTMGYGFPAAVGVQVGNPDETVVCLAGDGSLQMNIQELATLSKNNLPVKIFVFNNQYLGMVRQWQELFFDKRYSATCLRKNQDCPPDCSSPGEDCPALVPDFIKVAEGYGIKGKRVTKREDVREAIETALNTPEPYILDFMIEEEENVFPMVPAGGSLEEMLLPENVGK